MRTLLQLRTAVLIMSLTAIVGCQPEATERCGPTANSQNQAEQDSNKSLGSIYPTPDAIEIVESPATGVALGWGWNKGDSEPIPTICIEFVPGEEPAQTRYMTMKEVNDSYELMQSLGVSAEASVKGIGFEVSGKAAYAKSQNINSSTSTFVMNVVVQNGVRFASPAPAESASKANYQAEIGERGGNSGAIRLTPEAAQLASDDPAAFKHSCGASFVSAIYGGAKLTATLTFDASSKSEKESLSAEMSGSGWGGRVKGKVKANANKDESKNQEKMEVSIFMTGGKGDSIPASKQDLITKLDTISMDAYLAPKDFEIAITPYELLSNWPGKTLADKETEFDELASYWGSYNTLYDEIQAVLDSPNDYIALAATPTGTHGDLTCAAHETALLKMNNEIYKLKQQLTQLEGQTAFAIFNQEAHNKKIVDAKDALNKASAAYSDALPNELDNLSNCSTKTSTPLAFVSVDTDKLKRAQDEILKSLKRMENEARICSDKSDVCDFKAYTYRSPYAFRAQLPVSKAAQLDNLKDIVDYKIGRIAKNRCALSSNNAGCLSNKGIAYWAAKQGMVSVNAEVRPTLFANYADKLIDISEPFISAGMAQREALKAKSDATKPDSNNCEDESVPLPLEQTIIKPPEVLWYNPIELGIEETKPSSEQVIEDVKTG